MRRVRASLLALCSPSSEDPGAGPNAGRVSQSHFIPRKFPNSCRNVMSRSQNEISNSQILFLQRVSDRNKLLEFSEMIISGTLGSVLQSSCLLLEGFVPLHSADFKQVVLTEL